MSNLSMCMCGSEAISRPFANSYVFTCSNTTCFMSEHEFAFEHWQALMGRGEPVAWMYLVNGVHIDFSTIEPPDDAYDAGTLVSLYSRPVAAADDTARLSWLIRKLSGKALREMGVIYSAGSNTIRAAIDAAIKGEG